MSIQTLQQTYSKKIEGSTVSLSIHDVNQPPPRLPGDRSDLLARPTTAPASNSGRPSQTSTQSRRQSIRDPALSFFRSRTDWLVPSRSNASNSTHRMTIAHFPKAEHVVHSRTMSIQSNGSSSVRHFIDILDAQSEFKPTNFHSRVKAAGVREYGEDVAERNLIENGLDLQYFPSSHFYQSTKEIDEGAPAPVVPRSSALKNELPKKLSHQPGRSFRTMSLKSHTSGLSRSFYHESNTSVHSERIQASSALSKRRMTLSSSDMPLATSQSGPRNRSESMYITTNPRDIEFLNALSNQSRPNSRQALDPTELQRKDSYSVTHDKMPDSRGPIFRQKKILSNKLTNESHQPLNPVQNPGFAARSQPTLRRSASALESPTSKSFRFDEKTALSTYFISAGENHLSQQIRNSVETHCDSKTATDTMRYHEKDAAANGEYVAPESSGHSEDPSDEACPPPSIHTGFRGRLKTRSYDSFSRMGASHASSPSSTEKMEELMYEHMPNQNNEARLWSLGSSNTLPTTVSSIASLGPKMGHTPKASIDTSDSSYMTPLVSKNMRLPNLVPLFTSDRPHSSGAADNVDNLHSLLLNMDNSISAPDDNASVSSSPSKSGSTKEKDLLFRDSGYGKMQLPGLFDSLNQSSKSSAPVPSEDAMAAKVAFGADRLQAVQTSSHRQCSNDGVHGCQSSRSSSILSLVIPAKGVYGSRRISLRHVASAPVVRVLSDMEDEPYSSSEYDNSDNYAQESSICSDTQSDKSSLFEIPPIPPRRRPVSSAYGVSPGISRGLQKDDSGSESEAKNDHTRAEFIRSLTQIPASLSHHGPVLRIPLPIKTSTPDFHQPTLPAHQQDENNILPVHQIQAPRARKPYPESISMGHALSSLTYSSAALQSSSSEDLDYDEMSRRDTSGVLEKSRPQSQHLICDGKDEAEAPSIPRGYAYGHGGPAYGNGYGFIRMKADRSGDGSLPSSPMEEKDGVFLYRNRKLARYSMSRSESRGSMHSERAREIVRKLKGKLADEL